MADRVATQFLIVTSDTGGGHGSAANALAAGFARFQPDPRRKVSIVRPIDDAHYGARQLGNLYNVLLRHYQPLVKHYYWLIERLRPNESERMFRLALPYLRTVMDTHKPDVLISVHPMTQHVLAWLLRTLDLQWTVPLVTVVTDPCYRSWIGWACPDVQRYFVATLGARQQLLEQGVPADKIRLAGMPIHPKFRAADGVHRQAARRQLGLDPTAFTVFFNAGWVGGGNIPRIFARFIAQTPPPPNLQIIFLAGRNTKLQRWAEQQASLTTGKLVVLGYTNSMEVPMQAADVMVSKLGGLTTFEALALHLPIVIDATTPPMPQEAETVRLLAEHGAGIVLHKPEDIATIINSLHSDPDRLATLRSAAASLARPDATQQIVEDIVHLGAPSLNSITTRTISSVTLRT
jgi:UDP-N-acetylglucosamine:LPS N-acetylglucosamine transferase